MKIVTKNITVLNETLALTNQRVIFWKSQAALILSDLHIGKSGHFQRSGIPIPSDVFQQDLMRLKQLILHFQPQQLIVVGDLFHAEINKEVAHFRKWLSDFRQLKIILIKGNHDQYSNKIYNEFGIEVYNQQCQLGEMMFVHEPEKKDGVFIISGHIHPGVLLKGKGRQYIKLPCFQVNDHQLILPAFSLFTGLNTRQSPTDAVNYAFTKDAIFTI